MLDYQSLLLALGVSATCLMVTLFGTWFSRRTDSFLFTLVIALCLTIGGIVAYGSYTQEAGPLGASVSYTLLMAGFSTIYSGALQFRTGVRQWRRAALLTLVFTALGVPLMLAGLDGLGFIVMNTATAMLLLETARQYWLARCEAPGALMGMAVLYVATGVSFFLCGAVLIAERQWSIGHAPQNWAENLSIGVCIAGMTGIGALSLALHQWRMAAHHQRESMTDSLTGLLNRRALFDQYQNRRLHPSTAVVVFDIDRFKSINDQYGHAAGDEVLRIFAGELSRELDGQAIVARLGGEEFVMILENVLRGRAERMAKGVAARFSVQDFGAGSDVFRCTFSAGIAVGTEEGRSFEAVLGSADDAMFAAKRAGRNRVEFARHLRQVNVDEDRSRA
jgi:diguanylate cyclase (GGDEF)-like protein